MRGRLSSMHAQVGARDAQMVTSGRTVSGLSSVPTRTTIRCGRGSAALNRCVPQVGQNRRCIVAPLSAMLT
jgi:hypothetical protein